MYGTYTHSQYLEILKEYSMESEEFDCYGLLCLILAGLDNLSENSSNDGLQEAVHLISEEQADFMRKVLELRSHALCQNVDTEQ